MPVLAKLCSVSETDAALYLQAVIHCPCDETEREAIFARMQNWHAAWALEKPQGSLALWRVLQAAIGDKPTAQDSDATLPVQYCVYAFMRALIDEVPLRKTVEELGLKRSTFNAYWKNFKPAVHLAAAYHCWSGLWQPDRERLIDLLVIAEGLRHKGETHKMYRSPQKTLLDKGESWCVPACVLRGREGDTFEMPPKGVIAWGKNRLVQI
jgi:hypothetical protein